MDSERYLAEVLDDLAAEGDRIEASANCIVHSYGKKGGQTRGSLYDYVLRRSDGGMTILVKDEGVGMAAEDIPKALAVFSQVQVDDGNARRHEGTGLGLPIVKSLIELHGGSLTLTSEKGKGTTVRLDFPASAVAGCKTVAA